jgi:uncharacterized protein
VFRDVAMPIKVGLVTFFLSVGLAVSVAAGPLEDGLAAYDKGDYAVAIQTLLPPAQAGVPDALLTVGNMYEKGQGVDYDYAKALDLFGKAYSAGSYDGLAEIGNMYRNGLGAHQNYPRAVAMFQEASQHGSLRGESYLGEVYTTGQGVPVDYQRARTLFEDAANRGFTVALVDIGNLYLAGRGVPRDIPTAIKYYSAAAEKNSPQAMNNLGLLWQKGQGVTQDQAGALKLFERAGMLGENSGAYNAGWAYENGIGTASDLVQAYRWYEIGANEGGTFSAHRRDLLSTQLTPDQIQQAKRQEPSSGLGGTVTPVQQQTGEAQTTAAVSSPQDGLEAHDPGTYSKSLRPVEIRGDHENFQIMVRGQLLQESKSWDVAIFDAFPSQQDPKWVAIYYGEGGNACFGSLRIIDLTSEPATLSDSLGVCNGPRYFQGDDQVVFNFGSDGVWSYGSHGLIPVPKLSVDEGVRVGVDAYKASDFDKALRHLWPHYDEPNPEAPYTLGLMAQLGRGMFRDYKKAMGFFKAAAELEYPPAMFRIGLLYFHGTGVAQDAKAANEWFKRAAEFGDGQAQCTFGANLLTGIGAAVNPKEGLFWLLLSNDRLQEGADKDGCHRNIDAAEGLLTPQEISEVKLQAAIWKPSEPRLFAEASDLRVWIGRYPFDRIKGTRLLDVKELNLRLRMILGEEAVTAMSEMNVMSPAQGVNGWLVASGCRPHSCNTDHFSLGVSTENYEVVACARFDTSDYHFQRMVWGGTNYARTEETVPLSADDNCFIERVGVAGMKATMAARSPAGEPTNPQPPSSPPLQTAAASPPPPSGASNNSSGTGYVIDDTGDLVTAHHVVSGCRTGSLKVRHGESVVSAEVVASDERNDLAVINGSLLSLPAVTFRDGKGIRPADSVVAIGYPYAGLLATTPEVTTGTVTALAGIDDDSRYLQITAPIQPGNSGGPLFDLAGNVVGTVVSTLDPMVMASATGSLPQNVNFATKSAVVREFLDSKGISYRAAASTTKLEPADVGESGSRSVVMVECFK